MGVYERFFRLHDEPFRLTPDPRYLYPSTKHQEVLAHLRLGISESAGFVCITGDVGTGKTTVVRTFLDQLEPGTVYAYLFNPPRSSIELLQTINGEFGLGATATNRKMLVDALNGFLLAQRQAGHRPLVMVDEAQALAPDVLEELRLLSNLETATAKLLQIVLFGQPQLADLLQSADLAQLNQRITLRWHLGPLDAHETAAYVRHRLRVAGGGVERPIFSSRALTRIHRYTGGVPRLINMFCHRCLLAAFAADRHSVTTRIVEQVHDEIQRIPLLGPAARTSARFGSRLAWAAAGAAVVAALGVGLGLDWERIHGFPIPRLAALRSSERVATAPVAAPDVRTETPPGEAADAGNHRRDATAPARLAMLSASGLDDRIAEGDSLGNRFPPPGEGPPHAVDPLAADRAIAMTTVPSSEATGGGALGSSPRRGTPRPLDAREVSRILLATSEASSIISAVEAALERWGEPPLTADEAVIPIDLGTVAARRDLEHLEVSGTMNMLRVLNLPAIVEVTLPTADGPRYALLEGIGPETYVLGVNDASIAVDRAFIDEHWLGQSHVIWRDFERLAPMLQRGATGPRVARLQEMLSELGFYGGPINSAFGNDTESAVVAFQRSRRLFADALVGQLTRIALYDALGGYAHPRLAPEVADERSKDDADA